MVFAGTLPCEVVGGMRQSWVYRSDKGGDMSFGQRFCAGIVLLFSVVGASQSTAASPVAILENSGGDSAPFNCVTYYPEFRVLGEGTISHATITKEHVTSGWVRFDAANGQRRKFRVDYTREVQRGTGSATYSGSFVTPGEPLFAQWLYIVGVAAYAPSGVLGSYEGTAVDICAAVGYSAPSR